MSSRAQLSAANFPKFCENLWHNVKDVKISTAFRGMMFIDETN